MNFVKMHGFGNDFVLVDAQVRVVPELVRAMCDRRFGVGADGVLQVGLDDIVTMGYWNADGSGAEMCGNGLRCVARRAVDIGLTDATEFGVRTPIGRKRVRILDDLVSADLGPVEVSGSVDVQGHTFARVNVGNPHAVAMADPASVDLGLVGPLVERDPVFRGGVNVEFFTPVSSQAVTMRVWERGVGETLACGTGMVAVAAAARASGQVEGATVEVTVPGGTGTVTFDDGTWLTGPAETVFEGIWLSGAS